MDAELLDARRAAAERDGWKVEDVDQYGWSLIDPEGKIAANVGHVASWSMPIETAWEQLIGFVTGEEPQTHMCMQEGCTCLDVTECYLPESDFGKPDEFFCAAHARENGYCVSCGVFSAGIESFEVSRTGLCEHCEDELRCELGEYDDDEYDDSMDFGWYDDAGYPRFPSSAI